MAFDFDVVNIKEHFHVFQICFYLYFIKGKALEPVYLFAEIPFDVFLGTCRSETT